MLNGVGVLGRVKGPRKMRRLRLMLPPGPVRRRAVRVSAATVFVPLRIVAKVGWPTFCKSESAPCSLDPRQQNSIISLDYTGVTIGPIKSGQILSVKKLLANTQIRA